MDRRLSALGCLRQANMSEYQYYEFLAVDRPLDERQQDEVRALSTRARITATSFINEYHWGNFRGDPREMMERYYDAHLYVTNWGTHQVMLRIPRALLSLQVAEQYCIDPRVAAWACGEHLLFTWPGWRLTEPGSVKRTPSITPKKTKLSHRFPPAWEPSPLHSVPWPTFFASTPTCSRSQLGRARHWPRRKTIPAS
jgi:hypothetical protein